MPVAHGPRSRSGRRAASAPHERGERGEDGFAAGADAMLLGLLGLLVTVMIVVNGWAVIQVKFTMASASREAVRVYVEEVLGGSEHAAAAATAAVAGRAAAEGYGGRLAPPEITFAAGTTGARCTRVVARATRDVPLLLVPGVLHGGSVSVSASHSEVVDAYRSGIDGEEQCPR